MYQQLISTIKNYEIVGFKLKRHSQIQSSDVKVEVELVDAYGNLLNQESPEYSQFVAKIYKKNNNGNLTKLGDSKNSLSLSQTNSKSQVMRVLIKLKGERFSWTTSDLFAITSPNEITGVKYAVSKADKIRPSALKDFGHKGAYTSLTGSDFIHIKFTLKDNKVRPEYTIARLFHPEYENSTASVPAILDEKDNYYYATFDLGNPEELQAYTGKYSGKIFIADRLLEKSLLYTFGTFEITFKKGIKHSPLTDSQMSKKDEFEPNDPEPPMYNP